MRICRLTRTRGALLLVLSIARFGSPPQKRKRIPTAPESATELSTVSHEPSVTDGCKLTADGS